MKEEWPYGLAQDRVLEFSYFYKVVVVKVWKR